MLIVWPSVDALLRDIVRLFSGFEAPSDFFHSDLPRLWSLALVLVVVRIGALPYVRLGLLGGSSPPFVPSLALSKSFGLHKADFERQDLVDPASLKPLASPEFAFEMEAVRKLPVFVFDKLREGRPLF